MSAGLFAQYVVIVVAVVAAIIVVARKQFPDATRRLRIAIALPMLRDGSPAGFKRIGRWIAPPTLSAGRDCGGCNSCD